MLIVYVRFCPIRTANPDASCAVVQTNLHGRDLGDAGYIDEGLTRFVEAESYEHAKKLSTLLLPLISVLTSEHIKMAIEGFKQNSQLYNSFKAMDVIKEIFRCSEHSSTEIKEAWVKLYESFCMFSNGKLIPLRGNGLLTLIEQRYPDVVTLATEIAEQKYKDLNDFSGDEEYF